MNAHAAQRVHLIGIGGAGLSAIARVLLESGYQVSGSDRQNSMLMKELEDAGARIFIGHAPEQIGAAELVIRSSAIPDDNPEVVAARRKGIPVLKRAEFLGEWMMGKVGIAVAGTHGKTTTTAMIAWMMSALGQDPTFIVGGVLRNLGVNARAGQGRYFIIEADEYDRMFHGLKPKIAVVTNIEHDHPDCYPTEEEFFQAFLGFVHTIAEQGNLVVCVDDPGALRLAEQAPAHLNIHTYGITNEKAQVLATHLAPVTGSGFSFEVQMRGQNLKVNLSIPGIHNVRNALAALLVADCCNLNLTEATQALGSFTGVGRRFEVKGESHGITIIDDYGHHPTEIRSTLAAARLHFPGRRIWAVWQPHTYSRTRVLADSFAKAFWEADFVLVTEIYASREQPPADGFSVWQVVETMEHPEVHYLPGLKQTAAYLLERLQPGDVLIVFSAGDADQISQQVLGALQAEDQPESSTSLGTKEQNHV